jgi:hypothetical protein
MALSRDQVSVTENRLVFGDMKSGETVAVPGTLKNASAVGWKEVTLQVKFLNAEGKWIDTDQKRDFTFEVPANESVPFKVSAPREFPKEWYAKAEVRVISAKDARGRW